MLPMNHIVDQASVYRLVDLYCRALIKETGLLSIPESSQNLVSIHTEHKTFATQTPKVIALHSKPNQDHISSYCNQAKQETRNADELWLLISHRQASQAAA